MKRLLIASSLATAMFAAFAPAQAGAGPGSWVNVPTQGPSPNNSHTVSGTGCNPLQFEEVSVAPQGIAIGGQPAPILNSVTVRLFHPGPGAEIKNETYDAAADGTWNGVFEIPAGLPAGVYPLTARCNGFDVPSRSAGLLAAPVILGGNFNAFDYPPRSYTVVAKAKKPDPVEAEVTFTG